MRLAILLLVAASGLHAEAPANPAYDAATQLLTNAFHRDDPDERVQAVIACSMIGKQTKLLGLLVEHLDDKDVQVRLAIVSTLGEWKDPRAVAPLEDHIKIEETPEVLFAEARVLHNMGRKSGTEILQAVWEGEEKGESSFFAQKMRSVFREFKTPKTAFLFALRNGIGFAPVPGLGEGFFALDSLLSENDFSPRATALYLLTGKSRSKASDERLEQALSDKDWSVRAMAIQLISQQRRYKLKDYLILRMDDGNRRVRYRAAAGYIRLSSPPNPQLRARPN